MGEQSEVEGGRGRSEFAPPTRVEATQKPGLLSHQGRRKKGHGALSTFKKKLLHAIQLIREKKAQIQ